MKAPGARFAAILAVAAVAAVVADSVVCALSEGLLSATAVGLHGWPLVDIAAAGSAVLGAVIVRTHPRQPIGWLLNLIGTVTSFSLLAESYGHWVLFEGGPGDVRLAELLGWAAGFTGGVLAIAGLAVMFLLVPDGRVVSRGWWWVAVGAGAAYLSYATGIAVWGPYGVSHQDGDNSTTSTVASFFLGSGVILLTVCLLASVVSLGLRLRRSQQPERSQLRLVALGAALLGVSFLVLIVDQAVRGGHQAVWSSILLYAGYAFLLVCIAVAVLHHRLYDVELFVSRTLVVALTAAFAAVGYVLVVVLLGRAIGDRAGGFWLSLVAMVLVALAFQPLRRAAVRLADRLAYGPRAAPYDELAAFSRRIGHSPAPGALLPTVAAAAGEAVGAELVVVRLDVESGPDRTVSWPPGAEPTAHPPDLVVPVTDVAGHLGDIEVHLPSGRGIRSFERRLLGDIADQAAVAFRNVRLQVELAARVEQLDHRAEELATSRARLIGAADTERRRLESAVAREVLPAMGSLRAALADYTTPTPDEETIATFVGRATEALEALRELTRGIYPTMLARTGLGPAVASYAARQGLADALTVAPSVAAARYPEAVEAAAYFCCIEALAHGTAGLTVTLTQVSESLVVSVSGLDTEGFDRWAVCDRVEACGGRVEVTQHRGGASLRAALPGATVSSSPRPTPAGAARD
jgi:signal transduction histidine kinase